MSHCLVYKCNYPSSHSTIAHKCGKCNNLGHGQTECGNNSKIISLKTHINYKMVLPLDKQCNVPDCMYKAYHETISHNPQTVTIKCPLCDTLSDVSSTQKKCLNQTNICAICQKNHVDLYLPNCGHVCLCSSCALESYSQTENNLHRKDTIVIDYNIIEEKDFKQSQLSIDYLKKMIEHIDGKIYFIVQVGMGCCYYVKRDSKNSPCSAYFMHSDNWGQYGPATDDQPKLNKFITGYIHLTANMVD
jgi:hypothetical protein